MYVIYLQKKKKKNHVLVHTWGMANTKDSLVKLTKLLFYQDGRQIEARHRRGKKEEKHRVREIFYLTIIVNRKNAIFKGLAQVS